jgi:hypothetical protein
MQSSKKYAEFQPSPISNTFQYYNDNVKIRLDTILEEEGNKFENIEHKVETKESDMILTKIENITNYIKNYQNNTLLNAFTIHSYLDML